MSNFENVEDYMKTLPKESKAILEEVRQVIRKTAPGAEEVISYQLPALKFHGMLIYYSAYKDHISLSFPSAKTIEVLKAKAVPYELGKSTIKFPLNKPMPFPLIKEIVQIRMKENLEKASLKTKPKKR
ncbi:iron chaperone [Chitinophaga niabensis]|uniref:Uncharacterized conserved protein YdhG, YjbR/CyaY-like superfamily, DUF1801 family n=1 Tax=Chitinophaga niabensis TaxID=536979 RepID=A0A1N6G2M4_9BACT|nr:DUF1801 domain-containing protein [Chitinophaga niabensis]SIO01747.1 Uncharacterized conserved protein YdhG, YjbR/CyaY-like superfamily, DUF1801 family [Chitinophaga niabensis]